MSDLKGIGNYIWINDLIDSEIIIVFRGVASLEMKCTQNTARGRN